MSSQKRMFVPGKLSLSMAAVCLLVSVGSRAQGEEPSSAFTDDEKDQITDLRCDKMVQSNWGQGSLLDSTGADHDEPFFNSYLYSRVGTKAYLGCGAVALGQVMRYFAYPHQIELPGFSYKRYFTTQTISTPDSGDALTTSTNEVASSGDPRMYDFNSMPLNPVYGDAPSDSMAALLFDASLIVSSEYIVNVDPAGNDTRETKFDPTKLATALREKFAYSNAFLYVERQPQGERSAFAESNTINRLINANLDARQPVIIVYQSAKTRNEHVAVVDGYGYVPGVEKPYYHVNFCLGGPADGWYQLPFFTPIQNSADNTRFQCCFKNDEQKIVSAVVYNISPDKKGEIITGRSGIKVADDSLSAGSDALYKLLPYGNVEVSMFDPGNLYNQYDSCITENNGVYVLRSDFEGTTNVILEARYMDPVQGPLVAEKRIEVFKNIIDEKDGYIYKVSDKDNIGNSYGEDLVLEKPKAIVDGIGYASFERAIAAAHGSASPVPELKVVDEIEFNSVEWTIARDMIISSTNSNPRLTPILRKGSGFVRIAPGVNVTFTNVCFQALGDRYPAVVVSTNAVCTLQGIADIEVIKVLDDGIIDISAPIDESCFFKVDTSDMSGAKPFARSSNSASESDSAANLFIHLTDETLCGEAVDDMAGAGGSIVQWAVRPIPDSAAILKLEQSGTSVNYRSFGKLLENVTGPSVVKVVKNCQFTNRYDVAYDMTICSYSQSTDVTVFSPRDLSGGADGFSVKSGAKLEFENITFTGHDGKPFVVVENGGAFIMGEGAVLSDIVNREDKYAGAVDVKGGGYAKIEAGSTATRLSNITDSSFGGFLCLEPEAKCEIAGGAVNACFARGSGGAIYVARNAELLISGPAYINGNTVSSENIPSDIFLASGSSLSVASVLNEGSFGVTMPTGKNDAGILFASNLISGATADEISQTGKRFFNNYDDNLYGVSSDDNLSFVWARDAETVHNPLDEDNFDRAVVKVIYSETQTTQMWERLDWALNSLTGSAELHLLSSGLEIAEKVCIANDVTVLSSGGRKSVVSNAFGSRYDQLLGEYLYSHSIDIAQGASLKFVNVEIRDEKDAAYKIGPLFDVKGTLILDGSSVVGGKRTSADIAVNVMSHGEFVVTNGSFIADYNGLYGVVRSSGGVITVVDSSIDSNVAYVDGASVIVGSDTLFHVGGKASVAAAQLNAQKLILDSPLEAQVHIKPNYSGGARSDIFGVVGYDFKDAVLEVAASATNFVNDVTLEKGVVVTNSAGAAYLAWAGAIDQATNSFSFDNIELYLVGDLPEMPPVFVPAEPSPIAFVSIARNDTGTHWLLRLTNAVEKCRYYLFTDTSLEDGFDISADGTGSSADLTAENDGEFTFEVPVSAEPQMFFKVLALPEEASNR